MPKAANNDKTIIDIPTDFKIVLTSNKGDSNFNGEGAFSAKGGLGFGIGSFSTKGQAEGQITRKSSFSDFDSYVITTNNINQPDEITVNDLKALINELDNELKML